MAKKITSKRRPIPKKVGDVRADGKKVTSIKKVGSRTYYFYGPGSGPGTKKSTKPKPGILGSGLAASAGSKVAAHNKRTKARIAKLRK